MFFFSIYTTNLLACFTYMPIFNGMSYTFIIHIQPLLLVTLAESEQVEGVGGGFVEAAETEAARAEKNW